MFHSSSELAKSYEVEFSKIVNTKLKPPKPKHIRKIVLIAVKDVNLHQFMIACDNHVKSLDPLYFLKLFVVMHNVMRDGRVAGELWDRLLMFFKTSLPTDVLRNTFYSTTIAYGIYLKYKSSFHLRVPHFQGNLSNSEDNSIFVSTDMKENINLVSMLVVYFEAACFLIEKLLGSVSNETNMSLTTEGQARLFPLGTPAKDAIGICQCLIAAFGILKAKVQPSAITESLTRFKTAYAKFLDYIVKIKQFSYLRSWVDIPDFPKILPFEDIKPVFRAQTIDISSTNKPPQKQQTVDVLSEREDSLQRAAEKAALEFQDKERAYLEKIRDLQDKVIGLENKIQDLLKQFEAFKAKYVEKYNNDVFTLNKQVEVLVNKNNELEKLVGEMQAQGESQNFQEKFEKLKNLYIELRKESETANKDLKAAVTNLDDANAKLKEKQQTIDELTDGFEKMSTMVRESKAHLTSKDEEIAALNAEANQNKANNFAKLKQLTVDSEDMKLKYTKEIEELIAKMENLQSKTSDDSLSKTLTALFIKKFENLSATLNSDDDTQCSTTEFQTAISSVINTMEQNITKADSSSGCEFMALAFDIASEFSNLLTSMKGIANTCSEEDSKVVTSKMNDFLNQFKQVLKHVENNAIAPYQLEIFKLLTNLKNFQNFTTTLPETKITTDHSPEDVIYLTKERVKEASAMLEHVITHTKNTFAGAQLDVHSAILDNCKSLLILIEQLVDDSKNLQNEIVREQGGNGASAKQFYRKHHRWAEGLISAAKSVGVSAFYLVHTADRVVSGNASLEELIVSSSEITANVAQLVASSQTQVSYDNNLLEKLVRTSALVNKASNNVVASANSAISNRDTEVEIDFVNLSVTQARRVEMNAQIKILELESKLEKERNRLLKIRKSNYHLPGNDIEQNSAKRST